MKRHMLMFGLAGGLPIAILFATFGIWLGVRITRRPQPAPQDGVGEGSACSRWQLFVPNAAQQQTHGTRV